MEARTKIIAAVAVIMMCAAGLVGAGYAYTASTVNDGNTASPEYITLIQGEAGAYQFADGDQHVYWDAADTSVAGQPTTKFTLTGNVDTTSITGYTLVQLGKSFTLNTESTGATTLPDVSIAINATNFVEPAAGSVIFLKTVCNGTTNYYKLTDLNEFTRLTALPDTLDDQPATMHSIPVAKNGTTGYYPVSASVFYGYLSTPGYISVEHAAGVQPVGPSSNPIENAGLTFVINVGGANAPGATGLNGITLSKNTMLLTNGEASETATITFNPADATNKGVSVVSSNTDVVTVSETDGTITVTKVGAGTATITVKSNEGSYTALIEVTVSGIVLEPTSISGAASSTKVVTATLYGDAIGDVAWSGTAGNTVAASGAHNSVGTVTIAAAGTVTATVTIDGYEFSANCTVAVA